MGSQIWKWWAFGDQLRGGPSAHVTSRGLGGLHRAALTPVLSDLCFGCLASGNLLSRPSIHPRWSFVNAGGDWGLTGG